RFNIVGQPEPPAGQSPSTDVRVTDENFFRVMRIPLVRGRTYDSRESAEARRVVVVNEALARKYFPGEDPIGKRLVVTMSDEPQPTEIIGVVGDVKLNNLTAEVRPTVYWPHPELAYSSMTIVARTTTDPASVTAAARREIMSIDPDQPISDVRTMEELLSASVARARFSTTLLGVFAAVALLLAVVGIYAVMSYSVTQRTHEIGIRMALGAQARDVLGMVVGHGLLLALAGVGLGLLGAFALTRLMSSLLFGVTATDPITFVVVTLLLTGVALWPA
ncbi:MAG TPA: ABC transporter permease, partial [Pyrinomonadaceae bacterium]